MTDYRDRSPEAMEQRQAARVALMRRCLESPGGSYASEVARWSEEGRDGLPPAPRRTAPARPLSKDEQDLAAGLHFTVRERRREAAELEHKARRRRADAETVTRDRLHARYRALYGADRADRLMRELDA
ncbi:hypothetical protein J7F01_40350 [Streptomyces sp. ISL-22]|uniref:hypothetical protein n=1 Tax=unclassified Streptomyces TaxID=2593676 RepID=UPI001BE8B088|nr:MULTISPECIES: hypothetical protein [unclassified Streptomyces]MBT2420578.1 hypothetical protein [Streptomyces sp. ISL-24]MBT2438267.1 hypothetical protein [Streptomyces sp. ISL-22]